MKSMRSFPFRFASSFLGAFALCMTVASLIMAKREFYEVTINQILFHLQLVGDNVVTMPEAFIDVFFWHVRNAVICGFSLAFLREATFSDEDERHLPSAFTAAILVAALFVVPGSFIDDWFVNVRWILAAALLSAGLGALGLFTPLSWLVQYMVRWMTSGLRLFLIWAAIILYTLHYVNFLTYFQDQSTARDYYSEGAYVDPRGVKVSGSGNKNLLMVYCESIEETFGRPEIMGEDLLAPLRPFIESPDLQIEQMPGADFTIGGIVSAQCGIPLKPISILSGNLTGESLDEFLPGAVCLGDHLKADGYYSVYYNGSSGIFSGLDKFFLTHGYQEFMGKEGWLEKGLTDISKMNLWAMYDRDIVDLAIARIDELMAEGRKFSFAVSTMDTHEPGFLSSDCAEAGLSNDWPGYVKCSMSQVARLLQHIRDKGWEEEFVILVMGDHQTRKTELGQGDLLNAEGRYVLCSLRGTELIPMRPTITHFDLYPTVLAALGFTVEGDRLGLGYNVFSKDILPPQGYREELKDNVLSRSRIYEALWLPQYSDREM